MTARALVVFAVSLLIVAASGAQNPKPKTIEDILAELPKDKRPRDIDDTLRKDAANDWLKLRAKGQQVQMKLTVTEIFPGERDEANKKYKPMIRFVGMPEYRLENKQDDRAQCHFSKNGTFLVFSFAKELASDMNLNAVDAEKVEALSALKGKSVLVSGKVESLRFERLPNTAILWLGLELSNLRIGDHKDLSLRDFRDF